jgi:hypothetical protein
MRSLTSTVAAVALLALGGCAASGTPGVDARFGDALRALKAQQLIDPDATQRHAQATPPVDGRSTREAVERHADTYRNPPPTNVINIGVGAGGNGR